VFDDTFFKTFKSTLRISVIATLMCLVIGLPVAYFAAFKVSEKWRAIILALVVVPSFTSFLIRTVAWRIPLAPKGEFSRWLMDIGLIGDKGIQLLETQTAVQIAIVYNYLGFMILPLFVAFDRIDSRMREASKDLGAGRVTTFFSITLPLAGPGIAAGVLLTFIPMCGDYGHRAGRRQGQHDRVDDRLAVFAGPELAVGFGDGGAHDRRGVARPHRRRRDRVGGSPIVRVARAGR
jgi:spermidine/putrescine transport system permease protein